MRVYVCGGLHWPLNDEDHFNEPHKLAVTCLTNYVLRNNSWKDCGILLQLQNAAKTLMRSNSTEIVNFVAKKLISSFYQQFLFPGLLGLPWGQCHASPWDAWTNPVQQKYHMSHKNTFTFTCRHTFKWASLVAQLVNSPSAMQETWVRSLDWEDPLEKGKANQYSGLENSMDCIVHEVAKSWTQLSDFHFTALHNFKSCFLFFCFLKWD